MTSSRTITDQEIEDGLDLVAELIDRYGDVYWPVFDRLERELETRRSKVARLNSRLRRGTKKPGRIPQVREVHN